MPTPEDFAFSRLIAYAAYQWPGYKASRHHRLIARHLEAVERGDITRLMIFMPPRSGKSMLVSEYFPAWYLGRNPSHYLIAATYAQELADDFGRKVRNQIADPSFQQIFPGCTLKGDSQSAKRFHVTQQTYGETLSTQLDGAYFATGIGGPMSGRGSHLLLIDDAVKNREESDSATIRQRNKDWYTSTAYTRLMPGGKIVVVMCMVGDTPVLMADGSDRKLRDIRPGDMVASYHDGHLTASKVLNWTNQGVDKVYTVKTSSGIIVRANERHPFLVDRHGSRKWIRLRNLKAGDEMVLASGVHTEESSAPTTGVTSPPNAKGTARRITTKPDGRVASGRHPTILNRVERCDFADATESNPKSTRPCSPARAAAAPSVANCPAQTPERIGAASCALTTTTRPGGSEDCCATTATWQSGTVRPKRHCSEPLSTYEITVDKIVEIAEDGAEEVYDIEVEGTHNFIANGLVSHNTRWHEDDLAGWLLAEHPHENWTVLSLPAIAEVEDEIGRKPGDALWPESFPLATLEKIRASIGSRDWTALYQQRPTPAEGGIFKGLWFRRYATRQDSYSQIVQSWDTAIKADQINDPSVCTTWGIRPDGYDLLQVLVRRLEYPDLKRVVVSQADAFDPNAILIEDKASGQQLLQDLRVSTKLPLIGILPKMDKITRASAVSAMVEAGRVSLPTNAAWLTDYEAEMLTFPNAPHDDQVDSTTQFLNWMKSRDRAPSPTIRSL